MPAKGKGGQKEAFDPTLPQQPVLLPFSSLPEIIHQESCAPTSEQPGTKNIMLIVIRWRVKLPYMIYRVSIFPSASLRFGIVLRQLALSIL